MVALFFRPTTSMFFEGEVYSVPVDKVQHFISRGVSGSGLRNAPPAGSLSPFIHTVMQVYSYCGHVVFLARQFTHRVNHLRFDLSNFSNKPNPNKQKQSMVQFMAAFIPVLESHLRSFWDGIRPADVDFSNEPVFTIPRHRDVRFLMK